MAEYAQSPLTAMLTNDNYYNDTLAVAFQMFLVGEDQKRQEGYRLYREYYDGDHALMLTDRQKEFLEIKSKADFLANYCQIVVDVPAERLKVLGFDGPDGVGGEKGLLEQWWADNDLDGVQVDVYTSAFRDGDTYLLVEWDEESGIPLFSHELAYDGTEGMAVRYRQDRRAEIDYAVKYWQVSEGPDTGYVQRATVYRPDEILRYVADSRKGHGKWRLEERLSWVDSNGKPLGVPVVHFKDKANGYRYGVSKLKGVIPMQNLLNKTIADLVAAADTGGFRILTMLGNTPDDETTLHPGAIWALSNPPSEGALGFIPGEDMRPMIEVVDSFIMRIGQMTRIPLGYFQISGQLPSEGSQKQQENGIISMVTAASVHLGNGWERAMRIGLRLHGVFTGVMLPSEGLSTQWQDFELRDQWAHKQQQSDVVQSLVSSGASLSGAAKVAGFSDRDIKAMTQVELEVTQM